MPNKARERTFAQLCLQRACVVTSAVQLFFRLTIMRIRFRLRTLLVLTSSCALLVAFMMNFAAQKRREAAAITELSQRVLFAVVKYDGPSWMPKQFKDHWYFIRFTHIEMRLESTDLDRSQILGRLKDLPCLRTIELVAGDPFPQTRINLREMAKELEASLPGVKASLPPEMSAKQ